MASLFSVSAFLVEIFDHVISFRFNAGFLQTTLQNLSLIHICLAVSALGASGLAVSALTVSIPAVPDPAEPVPAASFAVFLLPDPGAEGITGSCLAFRFSQEASGQTPGRDSSL